MKCLGQTKGYENEGIDDGKCFEFGFALGIYCNLTIENHEMALASTTF